MIFFSLRKYGGFDIPFPRATKKKEASWTGKILHFLFYATILGFISFSIEEEMAGSVLKLWE